MSDENAGDFQSMLESLPDDLRSNEFLMRHKDFPSFAKSLAHNKAMTGRKGLIVPKEGDPQEVFDTYRQGLGVPDSADAYSREGLGGAFSDEVVGGLLKTALEAGVSSSAWEKLAPAIAGAEVARREAGKAASAENMSALKGEWGEKYDANLDLAARAAEAMYGDSLSDIAKLRLEDGSEVGTNPAWLKALAEIGESVGEGVLDGNSDGQNAGMSPDEAAAEIRAMWADEDTCKAMTDANHPQHDDVLEKKARLHKIEVGAV